MKQLFIILTTLFPLIIMGQNPQDSLIIIYKSDNLIEIMEPLSYAVGNGNMLDGYYTDPKKFGVLNNGEVKVYDKFYQLIEYYIYRDSIIILNEHYTNGKIAHQFRYIPKDSIWVYSSYYDNGNLYFHNNSTPKKDVTTKWHTNGQIESVREQQGDKEVTTKWYTNGQMESKCEKKGDKEKCDFWDEKGIYTKGIISTFEGFILTSQIEINKDGKEIRKIK